MLLYLQVEANPAPTTHTQHAFLGWMITERSRQHKRKLNKTTIKGSIASGRYGKLVNYHGHCAPGTTGFVHEAPPTAKIGQ